MNIWITIAIAGLLTFCIRYSFIFLLGRAKMPAWLERALYFVPITALSAIILPEVAQHGGTLQLSPRNPQIGAALLAGLVALRTKNVVWSIAVGMAALLVLEALL
ncbi:MAG: AzlD domain-containing protein [Anaerolineae bacterium]|nr:AzlD domain-containing protein [Anaerolineae bacterium]